MKLPRLGSACGILFAILLFAPAGDGSGPYSAAREVAATAALALAIPFLAYIAGLLRTADPSTGWLAGAGLAADATDLALKLGSGAPDLALHAASVPDATPVHAALTALANAATVLSLFPFAVFTAITAAVAFRTRALPLWLAIFAAVTAATLAVNGALAETDSVPGFLVFIAWVLVTSVYLAIRPAPRNVPVSATA